MCFLLRHTIRSYDDTGKYEKRKINKRRKRKGEDENRTTTTTKKKKRQERRRPEVTSWHLAEVAEMGKLLAHVSKKMDSAPVSL